MESMIEYNEIVSLHFMQEFTQSLEHYGTPKPLPDRLLNNIWLFNQFTIPIHDQANSTLSCGNLKLKYGTPENEITCYSTETGNFNYLNTSVLNSGIILIVMIDFSLRTSVPET